MNQATGESAGMSISDHDVAVSLRRSSFGEKERECVRFRGLTASLFRYDSGVEAIRLVECARVRRRVALHGPDRLEREVRRRRTRHDQHVSRAAPGQDDRRDLRLPRLSRGVAAQRRADRRGRSCAARRNAVRGNGRGRHRLRHRCAGPLDRRDRRARIRDGIRRALSGDAARRACGPTRRAATS